MISDDGERPRDDLQHQMIEDKEETEKIKGTGSDTAQVKEDQGETTKVQKEGQDGGG